MSVTRLQRQFREAAQASALMGLSWRHGRAVAPVGDTWPTAPETRERMAIRWPTKYEWPISRGWVENLRASLSKRLPLVQAEIEQPYEGAVLIEVELDGVSHEVAIDYFDKDRILDEVVERCPLVFKMQYRRDGYGVSHVVPGGFVPGRVYVYRLLPGLRHLRDSSPPRFEVYGRFGLGHAPEIRRAAVQLLRSQRTFAYEGDLVLTPYSVHMREIAHSQVCIDLPGNGDMAFRLIDYLAVGACIVRPTPRTRLHVPLTDGLNIRYVREDLSDLVDTCSELVADPARSAEMVDAARDYFDRYLHRDQLAGYYVDQCASIL